MIICNAYQSQNEKNNPERLRQVDGCKEEKLSE